jgi:hypothetical protein
MRDHTWTEPAYPRSRRSGLGARGGEDREDATYVV